MQKKIYGLFAFIALCGAAMPAMAEDYHATQATGSMARSTATAPGTMPSDTMRSRTTEVIETSTTRTEIVSESQLYGQQIVAALQDYDEASTFRNLMAANGISASLRENDMGYTAFVPVDRSLQNVTLPTPAAQGHINPHARTLLEDHVVNRKFDVNLMHGTRQFVTPLSGKRITISKAGSNYYANGNLIVGRAHNPEGIIYFVEGLIDSPQARSAAVYNPADVRK